jgi:hypothetical protein
MSTRGSAGRPGRRDRQEFNRPRPTNQPRERVRRIRLKLRRQMSKRTPAQLGCEREQDPESDETGPDHGDRYIRTVGELLRPDDWWDEYRHQVEDAALRASTDPTENPARCVDVPVPYSGRCPCSRSN